MIIFNEHVQAMIREKGSKRKSHMTRDELVKNFPHLLSYTQAPLACSPPSRMPIWKSGRWTSLSGFRSNKWKRIKVHHSLPMSYEELLPILTQNYGIPIILANPRRLPYMKGYDSNARCEYHGGVGGHSMENFTTFKDKVQSLINVDPTTFRELVSGHQRC